MSSVVETADTAPRGRRAADEDAAKRHQAYMLSSTQLVKMPIVDSTQRPTYEPRCYLDASGHPTFAEGRIRHINFFDLFAMLQAKMIQNKTNVYLYDWQNRVYYYPFTLVNVENNLQNKRQRLENVMSPGECTEGGRVQLGTPDKTGFLLIGLAEHEKTLPLKKMEKEISEMVRKMKLEMKAINDKLLNHYRTSAFQACANRTIKSEATEKRSTVPILVLDLPFEFLGKPWGPEQDHHNKRDR